MADFETIQSILCGPSDDNIWNWDTVSATSIQFNLDGTGKLILQQELSLWIACPLTWSSPSPASLEAYADIHTPSSKGHAVVASFPLIITLQDEKLTTLYNQPIPAGRQYNADILHPSAFQPKEFIVTLEKGVFQTQFEQRHRENGDGWPEFGLKLRFESSVFPAREEWRDARGAPDSMKFWTWDEFYRGRIVRKGVEKGPEGSKCQLM